MFSVSGAEIDRFRRDGFVVVDGLLSAAAVAALRERFARLFRGEFETGVTPDEVNWRTGSDERLTRQICNGWRADRTVAATVLREDLGRAIARLRDWPGTRVMIDNVLWKPPGARSLAHHQDNAYLGWLQPPDLTSCWMALDDTLERGGTLELVRGSHRWGHSPPAREFHAPRDYRKGLREAAAKEGVEAEIVAVEVRSGGGAFHHGWAWHGSGPNRSTRHRRALVIHALSSETRFCPQRLGEGTGPIYGRYKRLADDALDENFFPVTWREDGYRTPGLERFIAAP